MAGDIDWAKKATWSLRNLKAFIKGDYKVYIQEQSDIADLLGYVAKCDKHRPRIIARQKKV